MSIQFSYSLFFCLILMISNTQIKIKQFGQLCGWCRTSVTTVSDLHTSLCSHVTDLVLCSLVAECEGFLWKDFEKHSSPFNWSTNPGWLLFKYFLPQRPSLPWNQVTHWAALSLREPNCPREDSQRPHAECLSWEDKAKGRDERAVWEWEQAGVPGPWQFRA